MNGHATCDGTWLPLQSLVHGIVIRNFLTTESTRSINPHLVDLWFGSEVFGLEVLCVELTRNEERETWLRGYVVGNPSLAFDQAIRSDPTATLKPSVFIGIFPASHVQWDEEHRNGSGRPVFETADVQPSLRGTTDLPVPETPYSSNTLSAGADAVLTSIREAVQDWASRLPTYLSLRQYKLFDSVANEIKLLASYRLQLQGGILTKKQEKQVNGEVWKVLNRGRGVQGLDLVVRHLDTGRRPVLNTDREEEKDGWTVTPLRLYLAQMATAALNKPKFPAEEARLARLYLSHLSRGIPSVKDVRAALRTNGNVGKSSKRLVAEVKAIIIPTDPGESLELYLSVYDSSPTKKAFITEEFLYQAIKGGHITHKSSVAFDLKSDTSTISGAGGSLYLVVKVVRVVVSGMDGSYGRLPFGVAVVPLANVTDVPVEKVLQVDSWRKEILFSSMHEELVERKFEASANKNRIVVGLQSLPATRMVRNAALARSLSGPNPDQDVADVYLKLWSAILPEPLPDEVYVKLTLYSTDQHRLVDCIFPGGSGTSADGELEYKSVVWQKTNLTSMPVFGDLVRLRIPRALLKSGHVQFAIMGADRFIEANGLREGNERVIFSVELPLASDPGSELWVRDGEHTLLPPETGYGLVVRSLSLVPFGFKDINIAYVLNQAPSDISVDRISLLRYAPIEELRRHAERLNGYLFSVMIQDVTNLPLHAAVLDVLATYLDDDMLQALSMLGLTGSEDRQQAVQLLLEAVSLALSDRSRRNGTIKSLDLVCSLCRSLLGTPIAASTAMGETLLAIRLQLMATASNKDDHVGQTLALKHWPFSTYNDPEDIIKLVDCIRPATNSEHKSKMRFIIQALDELPLDDSLVAAMWTNIKASLAKADENALDVIHLATSATGRVVDAASLHGSELQGVLEYIGVDLLLVLLTAHGKLAGNKNGLPSENTGSLVQALSSQVSQALDPIDKTLVLKDIRACIAGTISCLSSEIERLLEDLGARSLTTFLESTWGFFQSIARPTTAHEAGSFGALEDKMWLRLCRVASTMAKFENGTGPDRHLAIVVSLIKQSDPGQVIGRALDGEEDAVEGLRTACNQEARPEAFADIVDLALGATSAKIRRVCHEALLTITTGGPSTAIEAFLLLLINAFVEGPQRVSRITMLVQEASTVWLTAENGWTAALEILPRLYDALENPTWTQPRNGIAYLSLLELVMPFPTVRKELILRLYNHIFDTEGTSTANLLLELAVLCDSPEETLLLRLHGQTEPRDLRVTELHEAAINEAVFACDLGLAGRILASLTVVAEREGDYGRVSDILTYRSKLARMMQAGSPIWRYFYVKLVDVEPIELIWRARNCSELLYQLQQYYPGQSIALRERSDRSLIAAETEIIIIEVDIRPFDPPKPLWSKHDNVSAFTLDLVDGDLEVYEVDQPLPGSLPFTSVRMSTRVVQTEQEVVGRRMRGKVDVLGYTLNGMSATDSNALSDLLDAAIEDTLMTTHITSEFSDVLIDYLVLLLRGLDLHMKMTRGTPMGTFHMSLVANLSARYPADLRSKAEAEFGAKNGRRENSDLLGIAFGTKQGGGKEANGDRPSEETLVHGRDRPQYGHALSPISTTRTDGTQPSSTSPSPFFTNPFNFTSPKTARAGSFSFSPIVRSESETAGSFGRSDLIVSPVARSPSVASRRIPVGVKRLGSLLTRTKSASTSQGVV